MNKHKMLAGITRFGGISILLLVLILSPIFTQKASAWFSPWPDIIDLNMSHLFRWPEALNANNTNGVLAPMETVDNGILGCYGSCESYLPYSYYGEPFDPVNDSYILYGDSNLYPDVYHVDGGSYFYTDFYVAIAPHNNRWYGQWNDTEGEYEFVTTGNYYRYKFRWYHGSNVPGQAEYMGTTAGADYLAYDFLRNVKAIYGTWNVDYDPNWQAEQFAEYKTYATTQEIEDAWVSQTCSTFDIFCWAKLLLVPSDDFITDTLDDTKTAIVNQLGILYFPIEFITDLFGAITSGGSWCSSSSCTKDFGDLFGGDFVVDFLVFKTAAPDIWNLLMMFIRVGAVLSVLAFAFKTLRRTLDGSGGDDL